MLNTKINKLLTLVATKTDKRSLEILHNNVDINNESGSFNVVLEAIEKRLVVLDPKRANKNVEDILAELWGRCEAKFSSDVWADNKHKNGIKFGGATMLGECSYENYFSYRLQGSTDTTQAVWCGVYINTGETAPRLYVAHRSDFTNSTPQVWADHCIFDEVVCADSLITAEVLFENKLKFILDK